MEAVKPRTREFKLPQWLHPTQIPLTATIRHSTHSAILVQSTSIYFPFHGWMFFYCNWKYN